MIKILLADDHALLRDGLRRSFESAGDQVVGEASTGEEAVALAKALQPDVVLMDLQMPEMDGVEASEAILEALDQPPPIIALTANTMPEDIDRYLKAGMTAHVAKPIVEADLLTAIDRAVRVEEVV